MDLTSSSTYVVADGKPKGRVKRTLVIIAAFLAAAAIVAQLVYTFSGGNRWEKLFVRNGVTVYARKIPGVNRKQFKATWRMHSTLSKFVMFAQKEESDLQIGYYDQRDLDVRNEKVQWTAWKERFPSPLTPREFVIKNEFAQDPNTKNLFYTVTATPNKIPPDKCCVRIEVMTNSWLLKPLKNGDIDVEWFVDMDLGGALPWFVQNKFQPEALADFAPKVQHYLERPKYANAKYAWIDDGQP